MLYRFENVEKSYGPHDVLKGVTWQHNPGEHVGLEALQGGRRLKTELLGERNDITFLAGHFSANSALAADFTTSLLTTDLAASSISRAKRDGRDLLTTNGLASEAMIVPQPPAFTP
mgnify:CR=1 FL=1